MICMLYDMFLSKELPFRIVMIAPALKFLVAFFIASNSCPSSTLLLKDNYRLNMVPYSTNLAWAPKDFSRRAEFTTGY